VRTEIFFTAVAEPNLRTWGFAPSSMCCIVAGRDRRARDGRLHCYVHPNSSFATNTNSFTSVSPDNGVSFSLI